MLNSKIQAETKADSDMQPDTTTSSHNNAKPIVSGIPKRTIKFRALKDDMSNCNFVYGQLVYDAIGQPRITAVDKSGQGLTFHTCINGTESQFTGLQDRNRVDIYDGDILKSWYSRDMSGKDIVWMTYQVEYEIIEGVGTSGFQIEFLNNAEIIGNVFENPELLD